jgi:hypothetical protein
MTIEDVLNKIETFLPMETHAALLFVCIPLCVVASTWFEYANYISLVVFITLVLRTVPVFFMKDELNPPEGLGDGEVSQEPTAKTE